MKLHDGKPYYRQISDWIRSQIDAGELKSNEKLPSENELCRLFDVSRVTVRRALQTLENDQLIYRCQGVGSFVSDHRTHQSFASLRDFNEELAGSGLHPSARVVSCSQVKAAHEVSSYLNLREDSFVLEVKRVRLGDQQPIAFDITWLPVFYGQLIESRDLKEKTIVQILEKEYEIPIVKGCSRIEAVTAAAHIAGHLKVPKTSSLLLMNKIAYSLGDKPVYFQKRFYRTDRMVFEIRTERSGMLSEAAGNPPVTRLMTHLSS